MITPLVTLTLLSFSSFQDKPEAIAKKDLPKLAECIVCSANGEPMGMEKPAAGVMYKGKAYYFCNTREVAEFNKRPDMYMPLELPVAVPELGLTDQNGKSWSVDAFKGRLVLLDYWATWCKPCLALKPKVDKVLDTFKDKGFEVVSVSIDEKQDTLTNFLSKNKWQNPVGRDTKNAWSKLKVVAIPALFLVKDGQVVAQFRGNVDIKQVEEAVKSNLL